MYHGIHRVVFAKNRGAIASAILAERAFTQMEDRVDNWRHQIRPFWPRYRVANAVFAASHCLRSHSTRTLSSVPLELGASHAKFRLWRAAAGK